MGFSLIYKHNNDFKEFDRSTFEGLESSIGGSYGLFNGSLFMAADKSYSGVSAGVGVSREIFGGKRDNKNFELSGAKLIKDLSIEPGPKKD